MHDFALFRFFRHNGGHLGGQSGLGTLLEVEAQVCFAGGGVGSVAGKAAIRENGADVLVERDVVRVKCSTASENYGGDSQG